MIGQCRLTGASAARLAVLATALMLGTGCGDDDSHRCGDGVLDPQEQCDDGNLLSGDGCNDECLAEAFCGNGVVEVHEECDDANDRGGDGCNSLCQLEVGCGNGRLDYGEQCDDDNLVPGDGCSDTCMDEDGIATCGNEILELGEGCDDGNTTDGDGCSSQCQVERGCGDGVESPNEQCDDGNTTSGDGCSHRCFLEYVCGDSVCDVDNGETCGKCPRDCCPNCGDGVLDAYEELEEPPYDPEECDDGNNVSGDGCSAGCVDEDGAPTCGNGILETGEGCDDGNTVAGDACSATCQWEFVCGDFNCDVANGETCRLCPADCCPDCGDTMIDIGEQCDGNALGGLTCQDFCFDGGTLGCTAWCDVDLSGCTGTGPVCGDGTIECGEQCEGSDLDGKTCASLGYDGGTLGCDANCAFDYSSCGDPFTSCEQLLTASGGTATDGVYIIDADGPGNQPSFQVYCDMTTDGGGWALVAALSNSDTANWVSASPWWYATVASGEFTNPATDSDAVAPAYFRLPASEFLIRDSVSGAAFRRSTGTCLGGQTFRTYVDNLNFTPGTSSVNGCVTQCDMQGTGTLSTDYYDMGSGDRARFGCNDGTDTAAMITLKTDTSYYYDSTTQCSEADWGLGSMESPLGQRLQLRRGHRRVEHLGEGVSVRALTRGWVSVPEGGATDELPQQAGLRNGLGVGGDDEP